MTEQPIVTLPNREPTIRVAAMPSDANYTGDISGGWLMGQVDIAGSIPAVNRAKGRVATVAVNSFVFKQPLFVGDIVSFYADIIKIGNTSITVDVEVYVQRNPAKPECVKVTEATLTYVAVDENRKPRVVPSEK
jgi:acyl-CoA thioesterase YciA